MAVKFISRDWGVNVSIVRLTVSDSLGVASASGYIAAQAANISAANNGAFSWLPGDEVLVQASDGNAFYEISSDFSSLVASGSLSPVLSGIVAHAGGGQANAVQLNPGYNVIATVATTGDSVVLPSDSLGQNVLVYNAGANSANVFPSSGANINALSANTALAVAAGANTSFYGVSATHWVSK